MLKFTSFCFRDFVKLISCEINGIDFNGIFELISDGAGFLKVNRLFFSVCIVFLIVFSSFVFLFL